MKQTILHHGFNKNDPEYFVKSLDFIYEVPRLKDDDFPVVYIGEIEYYVTEFIDEFTDNPDVQIRHIRIAKNLFPSKKHFFPKSV